MWFSEIFNIKKILQFFLLTKCIAWRQNDFLKFILFLFFIFSVFIAGFEEYTHKLIDHLAIKKIPHWDRFTILLIFIHKTEKENQKIFILCLCFSSFLLSVIREQASQGLFHLTKIDSQYVTKNGWYLSYLNYYWKNTLILIL